MGTSREEGDDGGDTVGNSTRGKDGWAVSDEFSAVGRIGWTVGCRGETSRDSNREVVFVGGGSTTKRDSSKVASRLRRIFWDIGSKQQ